MAGSEKLTGVTRLGATVHDFPNREHREREGSKTNAFRPFVWPQRVANMVVHGDAMASGLGAHRGGSRGHRFAPEEAGERERERERGKRRVPDRWRRGREMPGIRR
jgi:hypothetical protein